MGFIRKDFGTITVESRRESFIVHAMYGYKPGYRKLAELPLRSEVIYKGARHVIAVLAENYVALREAQFSTVIELPPETEVEVPGYEEDAEGPLAQRWREWHPEFLYADLDDLIVALEDLRESRTSS
jgi:hypothetical protein